MDEREVCRIVPTRRIRLYNVEQFRRQFYWRMIGAAGLTGLFIIVIVVAVRYI